MGLGAAHGATGPHRSVVVFGDSVPYGTACRCEPFASLYAKALSRHNRWTVSMTNLARSGATSSDVRAMLETSAAQSAVQSASTVVLMVGANDFQAAFDNDQRQACPRSGCYGGTAQHLKLTTIDIIKRVNKIHGSPVSVVVLDYWDVVADGRTGQERYGAQGEAKAQNATSYADAALHAGAQALGSGFFSTRVVFRGQHNDQDPTPLLASDGDHPNASGHMAIARALGDKRPHG
jgi:acyl-CoA thioesterase-1